MNIKRVDFGKWLQEKREIARLSQTDLAKRLKIGKSTISHWELGLAAVPLERLFDLAEVYDLDMDDIIEKLKENEPGIKDRFDALSLRFAKYHLNLMNNKKPSESFRGTTEKSSLPDYILSEPKDISREDSEKLKDLKIRLAYHLAQELPLRSPSMQNSLYGQSMIPLFYIKEYCADRIKEIDDKHTLLDIYYDILKSEGRSYAQERARWIRAKRQQLCLFPTRN